MVRRLVAACAAAALVASLSVASVSAAASPQAVLRASFNSYFTGGSGASYATWSQGAEAWNHAASTGIDLEAGAARIGYYGTAEEPQTHCASNLFGIWVLNFDNVLGKAGFAGQTWALSFGLAGGPLTPLAIQQTPIKPAVDPQGFWWGGVPTWWESVGVPVYGRLAPGEYRFRVQDSFPAYDFSEDVTFVVVIEDC